MHNYDPQGKRGGGGTPDPHPLIENIEVFFPYHLFQNPPFQIFLVSKTYIFIFIFRENFYKFANWYGGGGCQGWRFLYAVFFWSCSLNKFFFYIDVVLSRPNWYCKILIFASDSIFYTNTKGSETLEKLVFLHFIL